jgi:hypothetical protein
VLGELPDEQKTPRCGTVAIHTVALLNKSDFG